MLFGEHSDRSCDKTPRPLKWPPCDYVVEQHQEEAVADVPEFKIEISYVAGTPRFNTGMFTPGWKYVMRWTKRGNAQVEYQCGYATHEAAKEAAQERADEIAKAMIPTETYTYTPRLI